MIEKVEENIYKKCMRLKSVRRKRLSNNSENSNQNISKTEIRDIHYIRSKTFHQPKNIYGYILQTKVNII